MVERPTGGRSVNRRTLLASDLGRGKQLGTVALLERWRQACAPRLYGTATRDMTAEQRSLKGHVCTKTGSVPGSIFDCENHWNLIVRLSAEAPLCDSRAKPAEQP
jgi:hypothetical protein